MQQFKVTWYKYPMIIIAYGAWGLSRWSRWPVKDAFWYGAPKSDPYSMYIHISYALYNRAKENSVGYLFTCNTKIAL